VAHGEAGITLIEVMVCAVLAIVFLGAYMALAVRLSGHRQQERERALAMTAAINNLEHIRAVNFATLPSLDGSGFDVPGNNGTAGGLNPQAGDPDGLPGQLHVEVERTVAGNTLYRVTATVAWRGVDGNQHISIQALVAERK